MKVNRLKRNQTGFPEILRQIPSSPAVLFYAGAEPISWIDKPKVAIVGSRKVSAYGREVTQKLAGELARAGVVIISGLAYGVDSLAHKAVLDSGGITVAVLPTDIEHIYPAAHAGLAKQITAQGGTLISEYVSGTPGLKHNFIARNRIVSGLADILLITEAAINSGSLHTANFALEQGKTVMAVPGNITSSNSEGTNNLIKSGALPATNVDDVAFALGLDMKQAVKRTFRGSDDESKVLDAINRGLCSQEELAQELGLNGAKLNQLLTSLELSGHIRPTGGGYWST